MDWTLIVSYGSPPGVPAFEYFASTAVACDGEKKIMALPVCIVMKRCSVQALRSRMDLHLRRHRGYVRIRTYTGAT